MEPEYYDNILEQDLVDVLESMGQIKFSELKRFYPGIPDGSIEMMQKIKLKNVIDCLTVYSPPTLHNLMWFFTVNTKLAYSVQRYVRALQLNSNLGSQIQNAWSQFHGTQYKTCLTINAIYRENVDIVLSAYSISVSHTNQSFPSVGDEEVKEFVLAKALNNDISKALYQSRIREKANRVLKDLSMKFYIEERAKTKAELDHLFERSDPLQAYQSLNGKLSSSFSHLLGFEPLGSLNKKSVLTVNTFDSDKPFNNTSFYDIFANLHKTDVLVDMQIEKPLGLLLLQATSADSNSWVSALRQKPVDILMNITNANIQFFKRFNDNIFNKMQRTYFLNNWYNLGDRKSFLFLTPKDLISFETKVRSTYTERISQRYWQLKIGQLQQLGLVGSSEGTGSMLELLEPLMSRERMKKMLGGPVIKFMSRVKPRDSSMELGKSLRENMPALKKQGSIGK